MNQLHKYGYVKYNNMEIAGELDKVFLSDGKCNSMLAKHIIEQSVIPTLFNKRTYYQKFRLSNTKNYGATMVWHRDTDQCPAGVSVYTCIVYLDDTALDVCPRSHRHSNCNKERTIQCNRGDILLLDSKLVHKTTSNLTDADRRTVTIFNIVLDKRIYNRMIAHSIDMSTTYGKWFKRIEKLLPLLCDAINKYKKNSVLQKELPFYRPIPPQSTERVYDIRVNETCECVEPRKHQDLHKWVLNFPIHKFTPDQVKHFFTV